MTTSAIKQFSTVNALMSGLYDGVFPVSTVKESGNFGLGCSHALGGEVTIFEGTVLEARGDGTIREMQDSECLPFAQVTTFEAENNLQAENIDKAALHDFLAINVKLDNIFLAIKLDGSFANLKIRKPHQQTKPYKSVLEVVSEQSVIELSDVKGTMIGFWTPQFFDTIGVTGFHVHFISSNKAEGGHVIDFTLAEGSVEYQTKFNLDIQLPDDTSYIEKDLAIDDMRKIIKHVEN